MDERELAVTPSGMTTIRTLLRIVPAVILLALTVSCVTRKQNENLLAAAGFKRVAADTPQQQAHLKTLPSYRISQLHTDGKTYFIFPDAARQVLFVGEEAQYREYKRLRWQYQSQIAQEQQESEELPPGSDWQVWGSSLGGSLR
jgi:hypothetical protein